MTGSIKQHPVLSSLISGASGLVAAVALLMPQINDAKRLSMEAEDRAWKRQNGMDYYESAYRDLMLRVLAADDLDELQRELKGTR